MASGNPHNKSPSEDSDYQGKDPYFPIYGDGGAQWLRYILTAVATLVSAVTLLLLWRTLNQTRIAAQASVAQVESDRRPRLRVRREIVSGDVASVWVENFGESKAT
jgi:hypothetical protein